MKTNPDRNFWLARQTLHLALVSVPQRASYAQIGGNGAPAFAFPPLSLRFRSF